MTTTLLRPVHGPTAPLPSHPGVSAVVRHGRRWLGAGLLVSLAALALVLLLV